MIAIVDQPELPVKFNCQIIYLLKVHYNDAVGLTKISRRARVPRSQKIKKDKFGHK
jgi:hypothetical protein